MRINKYIVFISSIIISLLTCYFFYSFVMGLFMDKEYIESLNLPQDGDSLGIAVVAGMIVSFFFAVLHVFLHIIILIFTIVDQRKQFTFRLIDQKRWVNVLRILNMLIVIGILIFYFLSFRKLYVNELMFEITLVVTVTLYFEWIIFLVNLQRRSSGS